MNTTCLPAHPTRRQALLSLAASGAVALAASWPRHAAAQGQAFVHSHAAWTALLKKHVVLLGGGKASQARYAGFAADRAALKAYTDSLSAVTPAAFQAFSKPQQMAFLINAYNAFTVELILTRYPKLASIRDLGSLLSSPWKPKFIKLLGTEMSLDNIEHDTLRAKGRYDDPRIHFAVNCASVGCPMLREEAFVAERLDAQLDEQALRFLSDRSRNRYADGKLMVSKIFDWYGGDFKLGHRGIQSLPAYLARFADVLADAPADRERIKAQTVDIGFLDYDWKLNDAR
jgi:Protein of unknown function, DUF547